MSNSIHGGHAVRQSANAQGPAAAIAVPSVNVSTSKILLTDVEVSNALGISVRKFHELRHEPWFPRPIVLGPRLLRWNRAELEAAVANMPRQAAPAAEPSQLLRGRIERMKRSGTPA